MKLSLGIHTLLLASASVVSAWETSREAASQAFDLVNDRHTFAVATLSTQYADNATDPQLRGHTISGPEYYAPCFSEGDLLFLGLKVSQTWRNVLSSQSKNATVSIASNPDPSVPDPRHLRDGHSRHPRWDPSRPSWRKGMPSKGRATLFGHFEIFEEDDSAEQDRLARCYLSRHRDAKHWAPGAKESPHIPFWAKFVVDRVYWVGGFGDEHFIGWLSRELWTDVWQQRAGDKDSDEGSKGPAAEAESSKEPVSRRRHDIELLFADSAVESDSAGLLFQSQAWR